MTLAGALSSLARTLPEEPWRPAPPESQGFSAARLAALQADLAARGTKALLIIRHDAIVCRGIALMTYCVTAALRDAPQKDVRSLLRERIMRPIGVPDAEWSVGYGQTFTVGGLPLVASWGGGGYTARAAARVGRLMLRGGDWDGQRILDPDVG